MDRSTGSHNIFSIICFAQSINHFPKIHQRQSPYYISNIVTYIWKIITRTLYSTFICPTMKSGKCYTRDRADTSTSGNHQNLPYPLPSRPPMRSPSASGRRPRDLPRQRGGGEYCHTNNRECDMLYLYRHRAETFTSGNHQDLPHPLPSRPQMCSPSASGRGPRDLPRQRGEGESCHTNNRECDMLYLYRHRADTSTTGNHQDLPHPLPSRPQMCSPSASGRRPRDLPRQRGEGESCHTNNRECDMLYLYRHRADTSTTDNHQDLPHPLPSRPQMCSPSASGRRPCDLPQQRGGGEYRPPNNRECDMLYLYTHRADTSTSGNHQDLPHPLPSDQLSVPLSVNYCNLPI